MNEPQIELATVHLTEYVSGNTRLIVGKWESPITYPFAISPYILEVASGCAPPIFPFPLRFIGHTGESRWDLPIPRDCYIAVRRDSGLSEIEIGVLIGRMGLQSLTAEFEAAYPELCETAMMETAAQESDGIASRPRIPGDRRFVLLRPYYYLAEGAEVSRRTDGEYFVDVSVRLIHRGCRVYQDEHATNALLLPRDFVELQRTELFKEIT